MKKIILLILIFNLTLRSQTKIDTLYNLLRVTKTDTGKVNVWIKLSALLSVKYPDSAYHLCEKAVQLSNKLNYRVGFYGAQSIIFFLNDQMVHHSDVERINFYDSLIINLEKLKVVTKSENYLKHQLLVKTYRRIGYQYSKVGRADKAIEMYTNAGSIAEKQNFNDLLYPIYRSLGFAYNTIGNYSQAIKYGYLDLKLAEKEKDYVKMSSAYTEIGGVYFAQKKWSDALIYYNKALVISEREQHINALVIINYCIASIYIYLKDPKTALNYANKANTYSLKENLPDNRVRALEVLADSYSGLNQHELAINTNKEAIKIAETISDSALIADTYCSMIHKYKCSGNLALGIKYGEKCLGIAQRINHKELTSIVVPFLIECYARSKNFQKAYELKLLEIQINDSILSKANENAILDQTYQYQYQKKSLQDSLSYINQQKIVQLENQSKLKVEQNKRVTLYIILGLLLILAGFIFNRFKASQKQKKFIETQSKKLEVAHLSLEEKTREIQDSIIYSKEIQNIFLKSITQSKNYFNDSILYYKPKAIVSGDFYWYKELDDNLFVVVGDCTGHGVPGAIISVLAIQTLDKVAPHLKSVENLHEINVLMNNEFKQYYLQEKHVSIGLDFSIICLNKISRKLYLSGSGATILLKNKQNKLLVEKFESINIGGIFPYSYQPATVSYDINNLQSVYLYTDGIVDQKSEQTNKKYGTEQLRNLIANLNTTTATEAFQKIETSLNSWKGNSTQIDDMTLLGIQFN